jgi:uncharacterized Rossmann fold enzyme
MSMDFIEWEPIYTAILDDFGFDRAADERSRDLLADITSESGFDLDSLTFDSEQVAIAGGGPSFVATAPDSDSGIDSRPASEANTPDELALARRADRVVAVSRAADVCRRADIAIDLMVTDLDTNPETAVTLTHEDTPVAVAAHGDNVPALREYVPEMDHRNVLPTTQAEPHNHVVNVGGFTDGDRAAFIADYCGANKLVFPGWDFDDQSVDSMKRRKLVWAERLLRLLELRRNERFAVLDGRRDDIDMSACG